jgi:hypothetical protein
MALTVFYTPRWRAIDANGNPMNGAILKFFEAGTSTPLAVYADVNGNTAIGVTATADAGGLFAEIFMLAQAYKVELYTSANVLVWSADNFFPPQPSSAASVSLLAVAGVTFAAGEAAYLSDGSGALNAGQMYKGDADLEYASLSPMVFFATGAITAGNTGLFISEGAVTGLSGLTPGARYYLSGTAGAISTTPGAYSRLVGQARTTTELAAASNPPIMGEVADLIGLRAKDIFDGRLSLTSGTPVTPGNVTAAGTLYLALYKGNQFGLYTGSKWTIVTLAELSVAAPAAANQVYDVFLDYNDGAPQLVLLAWTNDTTRATALTKQDGVYVKTGDTQQRYTGTVRTVSASQFNDSETLRHVSSYYNRVPKPLLKTDATATWNYTTATIRQARADATNQVDILVGVQEMLLDLQLQAAAANSSGVSFAAGIGEDSTSTFAMAGHASGATIDGFSTRLTKYPAIGRHVYSWNEWSAAVGTTAWYGTQGDSTPAGVANGLRGWIEG